MKKILLFSLFSTFIVLKVGAQTWDGGASDDNWNSANNWSPNGVPAAGANVSIPSGSNVIVTADATCNSITFTVTSNPSSATLTVNSGITLTVTAGITLNNATQTNSTVTIAGSGTINCASVTIGGTTTNLNDDHTITLASTIEALNISGNLTIRSEDDGGDEQDGVLSINAGTITVGGSVACDEEGGGADVTLVMNAGAQTGTLVLSGATPFDDIAGTLGFTPGGTGATVNYSRAGAQTIRNATYTNLSLSGTGTKTLGGNTTVNGILSLQGNPTIASLGLGGFTLTYGATSTLQYQSVAAQTSTNSEFPASGGPFNLIINNAAGVSLHSSRTIPGTLTLTNGNLNLGTNTITLSNATDATQLSGGSASSYIIATGAGRLFRDNLANSVAHAFPVGTSAHYLPVIVNPATGTTNDFAVNVFQGVTYNATEGGTAMNPKTGIVDAVWNIDRISGSGNATITLNWNAGEDALEGSNFAVWPDSYIGISRYAGGWQVSTGTGNNTSNTASGSFGSFGPFGVGLSGAALPVKITSIKAYEKQGGIQVDWTADTEENLEKYEVERSSDGVTFTVIGQQIARNSSTESKYSYFDATPLPGISFYRLRSVDFGATKSSYSSIVRVSLDKSVKEILVYPNPVRSGTIAFQSSDLAKGSYTASVMNAAGQQVFSMQVQHSGGYINQTLYLPSSVKTGMYTLLLNKGTERIMSRVFIVQ